MLLPRGRIAIAGLTVIALLGIPRTASADFIDWILDLSGPPMAGAVLIHCEFGLQKRDVERPSNTPNTRRLDCYTPFRLTPVARWAITFEPPVYFSTGQDNGPNTYRKGQFWLVSLDPMVEWRTSSDRRFVLHQGIGGSFSFFRGDKISGFHRYGVKSKPIGILLPPLPFLPWFRLDAGVNLRWYHTPFLGNEFGGKPSGKREHWVPSINFSITPK